jgi:mannosidase alpha-like ER degradation enhancer 2
VYEMFDHGFSNYMRHAYPMDNLLPSSCAGKDWQGGMALTLVDSLDALLLIGRREDVKYAVELLRGISFDMDVKVHLFEVVIRVLGGQLMYS